jgi:hypothetical protein
MSFLDKILKINCTCKGEITTSVERHLPDDMYTQAAISLMDAFETGEFEDFEKMCDKDVQTILYSVKEIQGKSATSKYLKDWREKYINKDIPFLMVKFCRFCSHAGLIASKTMGDDRIIFLFNFKHSKISQILLMPLTGPFMFKDFVYLRTHIYDMELSPYPWFLTNMLYFLYKFKFTLPVKDDIVETENFSLTERERKEKMVLCNSNSSYSEIEPNTFYIPVNIPLKGEYNYLLVSDFYKNDVYLEKAWKIFSVKYDLINLFCAKKNDKSISEQEIENIFLKQEVQKLLSELTEIEFCDDSTIRITTSSSYMEEDAPNLMIGGKDNDLFHIWADKEHEIVCVSEIDDDKDIWISKLDIDKHIRVNPTEMGAWQLFLLVNLSIILPSYCWHTSCGRKEYVFNETDLENVINKNNSYHNRELKHLMHLLKNNLPKVEIVENKLSGCTIQIGCCYWGDWSGLNKEETKITIVDRQCVSYETKTTNLYHSYNNGIYF